MTKTQSQYVRMRYFPNDPLTSCASVTFQITTDCCLRCTYCYQINKGHEYMSKDTMKQGMDLLFQMYEDNDPHALINKHTHGIGIEFLGGEAAMNMEVMDYGSEYFLDQVIKRNHIWASNFRFNISSNGVLYFTDAFQQYLNKYGDFLYLGISMDGLPQLHDACRVDVHGNGSFDKAFAAYQDWTKRGHEVSTKITSVPETLPYFYDCCKFFVDNGITELNGGPIHEHTWTTEEGKIFYYELKKVADLMLSNPKISASFFNTQYGLPRTNDFSCGAKGHIICIDSNGIVYPCPRLTPSAIQNKEPITIGNIYNGIYKNDNPIFNQFVEQLESQECINCQCSSACASCFGWNYERTGQINKKDLNCCWVNRALALANYYYWNKKYIQEKSEKRVHIYLEREIATKMISNEEYNMLIDLEKG